jgi:DNA-binding CsgD family transcriptional regulator
MLATRIPPIPAPFLLEPQREVLALAAEGKAAREIGAALGMAPGTVNLHIHCARRRTGCATVEDLVAEARRRGLI